LSELPDPLFHWLQPALRPSIFYNTHSEAAGNLATQPIDSNRDAYRNPIPPSSARG
jgi:hypothetical protein